MTHWLVADYDLTGVPARSLPMLQDLAARSPSEFKAMRSRIIHRQCGRATLELPSGLIVRGRTVPPEWPKTATERSFQYAAAERFGGVMEVTLPTGDRVDLVTPTLAIEVKDRLSLGRSPGGPRGTRQAIRYAERLDLVPVLVTGPPHYFMGGCGPRNAWLYVTEESISASVRRAAGECLVVASDFDHQLWGLNTERGVSDYVEALRATFPWGGPFAVAQAG